LLPFLTTAITITPTTQSINNKREWGGGKSLAKTVQQIISSLDLLEMHSFSTLAVPLNYNPRFRSLGKRLVNRVNEYMKNEGSSKRLFLI
jgi:hypothetical protein